MKRRGVEVGLFATRMAVIPELEKLQERTRTGGMSFWRTLWRFFKNDLYSDFEKEVLKMKPNDCPIVQKYSKLETFVINSRHLATVTLSTFHSEHPLREFHKRSLKDLTLTEDIETARQQLEQIEQLPVVIFIHGLGGQMSQFEPIMQEFRNCSDMFAIDLPGFGNSKRPSRNDSSRGVQFNRLSDFEEYDLENLEDSLDLMQDEAFHTDSIVEMLHEIITQKFPKRKFIIISHSMGTHISIKLINELEAGRVESLVMMAPPKVKNDVDNEEDIVLRLPFAKKLLLTTSWYTPRVFDLFRHFDRYNGLYSHSVENYIHFEENEDDVLKRLTQLRWNLDTESVIFLKYVFGFKCATTSEVIAMTEKVNKFFLCCGEFDTVTPIEESMNLYDIIKKAGGDIQFEKIPNANHSLFLDKPYLLAGSIYQYIEKLGLNISCTWVLQIKAWISGDKWGLKNEAKWNKVITLSDEIIGNSCKPKSYLLGMKTLRETDELHNPKVFESQHNEIYAVVDIGSDTPSYEPQNFQRIKYVKYKTESKVTPDNVTILKFIEIVSKLMDDREDKEQFIVVHCHYGQNRTGFLICCYLIEKLGWSVSEAIQGFEKAKPPGIKHVHFKNALHLRYQE